MKENIKKVKWLMQYVSRYKLLWISGLVIQVLFIGFYQISNAFALENLGTGMVALSKKLIVKGLIILLIGAAFAMIAENFYWRLTGKALACIRRDIKVDAFSSLLRSEDMLNEEDATAKMEYINQDIELAMSMIGDTFKQLVLGIGTSIITMLAIISKNVFIAVICIVTFLISVLINVYYIVKQRDLVLERIKCNNNLNLVYTDILYGAKTIRNLKLQKFMTDRVKKESHNLWGVKKKERKLSFFQNLLSRLFLCVNNLLPMAVGLYFCAKGHLSVGTLFFLVQIILQFNNDYEMIGPAIMNLSRAAAGVDRLCKLEKTVGEIKYFDKQNENITLQNENHFLTLNKVEVEYESGKGISIDNIELNENNSIAIVGKSGSGKSTLLKVLLQLIPYKGEIIYKGNHITKEDKYYFRNEIAYAGVESKLFDGKSILQNIRYGNEGISLNEIKNLFERIGGDDFILKFDDGYETIIGEEGMRLSGGEEERIILARALVKKSPIVILDEVTSAMNSEIRSKIYKYIEEEKEKRTFIFATHDMKFAHAADWVIVLDFGKVVSQVPSKIVLNS